MKNRDFILSISLIIFFVNFAIAKEISLLTIENEFPIRIGEKLTYSIKVAKLTAGSQVIEVERKTKLHGRNVYRVHSRSQTDNVFNALYHFVDDKKSWITTDHLFPIRHVKHLEDRDYFARVQIDFDHESQQLRYLKNDSISEMDAPHGTQDELSMIFFLRAKKLEIGKIYTFPIFVRGKPQKVRLRVVQKDVINTILGKTKTLLIETSHGYKMWMTDDRLRIPVKIEAEIRVGKLIGVLKKVVFGK